MSWEIPPARSLSLENRDGIPWFDAPLPWRFHLCKWQTRIFDNKGLFQWCACGATSYADSRPVIWHDKNRRRRS